MSRKRSRRRRRRTDAEVAPHPASPASKMGKQGVSSRLGALYAAGPALTLGAPVQAQVALGRADSPLEREADGVATGDEEPLQTRPAQGMANASFPGGATSRAIGDRGDGEPLNRGTQRVLESRLGANLEGVRVHRNGAAHEAARELGARAFTHRDHIWLGPGASQADERLMAHEATHVVQQRGMKGNTPAIMRDVDEGKYYPDRAGAVARGRELQQSHMNVEIFQRPDENWQVRYSEPVPEVKTFPHVDAGKYYPDVYGAEARARKLRAYGFVVQVFQRPDENWQCRITGLMPTTPRLPRSTGPDAGFYYERKPSAETRAEALHEVGYTVELFRRDDENWQVRINALPSFDGAQGTPAAEEKEPEAKPATEEKEPAAAPKGDAPKEAAPEEKSEEKKPPVAKTPAAKAAPKSSAPPHKLVVVNPSDPDKKKLSDAVAQSYRDFVAEVKNLTGEDLALDFGDTVRALKSSTSKVGADTVSWHKTGRAVDINQGLRWVIREDPQGGETFFRLYLRHKDKEAAVGGNVVQFAKGTTFHHNPYAKNVFKWSFVDVTAIAAKHGWNPIPAQSGWKKTYNKREWWHFEKREGKSWYEALTDIYTEKDIVDGIKSFASGTSGANRYGARLKREGVPTSILKKVFSSVTKGSVTLLLPVGEGRKAANLSEDVRAVQEALIKAGLLTGTATGVYDEDTKRALIEFQKDVAGFDKPDGRVDVGGTTHEELGAAKAPGSE